ncbi:hypothetical protein GOV03_01575 [Candidatus Woesearchaeota archaeon]|nr:hypothetical protein [Candidatus Woesearchaeota archaeon]
MSKFDGISLGDIVEIEFRTSFAIELSRGIGYVVSLDLNRIVLSTYDINRVKPSQYEFITYHVKDIRSCTKLKK